MTNFVDGNVIRLQGTFTNSGGVKHLPQNVFLAFSDIVGVNSVDVASLNNPETGVYYYDLAVSTPQEYIVRWTATGSGAARSYSAFMVSSLQF